MSIDNSIKEVDWSSYEGPEDYNPEELIEALLHLNAYDESNAKNGLDNKVLFAVGNNHRGTYYPAILGAADLLIKIESSSTSKQARKCAYAILNDLYYFEPEVGSFSNRSFEEIAKFVENKLRPYSDET